VARWRDGRRLQSSRAEEDCVLAHDVLADASSLYFPVRADLASKDVANYWVRLVLRRNQRRGWRLMKVCVDRLAQVVKTPNDLVDRRSRRPSRYVRTNVVQDHRASPGSCGGGWPRSESPVPPGCWSAQHRCGDEAKVAVHVRDEAVGQVAGLARLGQFQNRIRHQGVADGRQSLAKTGLRSVALPTMDGAKQFPQVLQEQPAITTVGRVGVLDQELHVSDQMGQANCTATPKSFMYLR